MVIEFMNTWPLSSRAEHYADVPTGELTIWRELLWQFMQLIISTLRAMVALLGREHDSCLASQDSGYNFCLSNTIQQVLNRET